MMPSGTGEWNIKYCEKRCRKLLFNFLEGFIPPRVMAMVVDSIPATYGWWQVHPWKSCWLIPECEHLGVQYLAQGYLAVLWSWPELCVFRRLELVHLSGDLMVLFALVIHDWLVKLIYLLCRQLSDCFAAHSVAVCLWWLIWTNWNWF